MPSPLGADVIFQPTSLNPVTIEFRLSWGIDARDGCYSATAYHTDQAGQESAHVTLGSTPECSPVPEPTLALALMVGALWLGAASVLAPAVGRMLARNSRSYPPVPEREKPPTGTSGRGPRGRAQR